MTSKIEQLVDLIYDIQTGGSKRTIKLVIGDGFYSQKGIKSRSIIIEDIKSQGKEIINERDEDRYCWQTYEKYRWDTLNNLPVKRYFYTHHFCREGLISSIITTNYDLYFDSIFTKYPLPQGYILNPAIDDNEDSGEGFYGKISASNDKLRLWKIHGSFSHISFINSSYGHGHIFKLPNFAICYPADNPIDNYGLPSHAFMGASSLQCDCDRIAHFIDMNFINRIPFEQAINGSIQELDKDDTGLVICLGFTGRYNPSDINDPLNEELTPYLVSLSSRVPVYVILARFQDPRESFLYNELHSSSRTFKGDIENILRELIQRYYDKFGMDGNTELRKIDKQYVSTWVNDNLFNIIPYE